MACKRVILDDAFTKGRFTGRVAVVTGGASGIGRAVVERFSNDGAAVHFFDINEELGREVESSLHRDGYDDVTFHKVDVSNKAMCEEAVAKVAAIQGGEIHMLFNGAAICIINGLDTTQSEWDKQLSLNIKGYSNMVQCCFPFMKQGQDCSVVNVSSITAHRALKNTWAYSASKGAVVSLTRCMALDLASKGIRVNSLSPSLIWTPMLSRMPKFNDRELMEKDYGPCHALGRIGEPADVASTAAFLCSRDARFITGVDIPVDGGFLLSSALPGPLPQSK